MDLVKIMLDPDDVPLDDSSRLLEIVRAALGIDRSIALTKIAANKDSGAGHNDSDEESFSLHWGGGSQPRPEGGSRRRRGCWQLASFKNCMKSMSLKKEREIRC